MSTESLRAADRAHVWHPFTQQHGWLSEDAPIIDERAGSTLYDTDGNAYIDGVSSLWCNVHGHRHPAIDAAIRAQLDRVAHSTMLGLSHPPAIELAERLRRASRPTGPDARLLLRQRLDGGRDRAEDGVPVVPAPARRAAARPASSACDRATTATRSARSRSAASTSSTRCYRPLLFDADRPRPATSTDLRAASSPSTATRSPR